MFKLSQVVVGGEEGKYEYFLLEPVFYFWRHLDSVLNGAREVHISESSCKSGIEANFPRRKGIHVGLLKPIR